MFLSREIDIKLCQICTKIHKYAAELPPMRVQYTGHVSMYVSHDKYTALPLVEVLMTSFVLPHNIINYISLKSTISIQNCTYMNFRINLTQFYINFSRQEHQI